MEENRGFSLTDFIIKAIIVIIFVLFTVWLISLSNKGLKNSVNVLTDEVFSQNIDKMKEVGKSYFTTERLPESVGDTKVLTLQKMYDQHLILGLQDKNGNACNADTSYVSIEKMDNEYQMKVYLDCGGKSDYVIVIMGCYDYCESDICEKRETIEYEYVKTTYGKWSNYGAWSDWSKNAVSATDARQVDTKVEQEDYTYDKEITEVQYVANATCPEVSGYVVASINNGVCNYTRSTTDTVNPTCPTVSGYTLTGLNGFTCSYSKSTTANADPTCPAVSGYTLTGRNGFTCSYSKSTTATANPTCPTVSGYTYTGRNGFTCTYSKSSTVTVNPTCPSKYNGGSYSSRSGFTCYYKVTTTSTSQSCQRIGRSVVVPTMCGSVVCGSHTETVYENVCTPVTTTSTKTVSTTASCPSGYDKSGSMCAKTTTDTTTKDATCPTGYNKSGNACVATSTSTTTKDATCPTGYNKSGNTCVASSTSTTTKDATCPSGYTKSGNTCAKQSNVTTTKNAVCPSDQFIKDNKCYKNVTTTKRVTEKRNVTYYRFRDRSYSGDKNDYKWSKSDNDKSLLNAGYKLTGKTRNV